MNSEKPKLCHACRRKVFKNTECDRSYCPNKKGKFKNKVSKSHSWYNLQDWRGNPNKPLGERGGLRESQLMRHPLCEQCLKNGIGVDATVVDHIKEFKKGKTESERWFLFIDENNHQSLCASCHNSKTAKRQTYIP